MNRFERASIVLLFKKQGCSPCKLAQKNLRELLLEKEHLGRYIKVMDIEHQDALRGVYFLDMFPVALLLDAHGKEIKRTYGGRNLTKQWFETALTAIKENHGDELPL